MASTYKRRNREFEMLLAHRADDLQGVRGYHANEQEQTADLQREQSNILLGDVLQTMLNGRNYV
jgi:hypothetical protein